MPLPVARMAGSHGPLRADTVDGRGGLFLGQRRRGGVLRTNEDGIRPFRALGGAYPRRGARPDRRLHPLVQPRAHQTAARLDESGTIPSEPGNGCVIISKKTSAAPYLAFWVPSTGEYAYLGAWVNGMFWSMIDRSLLVINVRIHGHSSSQFVPTAAPGP